MEKRRLGRGGPQLTVIGFGTWAIGGPWIYGWGPVEDRESVKAICRAVDAGVNWIDTAAAYGFGHSEEVVAKALKEIGRTVFVATKCGLVPDGKGDVYRNSRPESIRKEIEASLRRLQLDCVDLYQIHWPDDRVAFEDSWGTLLRLKEEGKTRFIGVSNYDVPMMERCMSVAPIQSLQPPYSLLTRDVEKDILPYCRKQGIGVIAYSPMQSGLLTGRFDMKKLASDDWRHKDSWFQEPKLLRALRFVEKLRPIAGKYRKTVGQLAVQCVLRHEAVAAAIVGARRADQVEENVGAADFTISKWDFTKISDLLDKSFEDGENQGPS